MKIIISFFSSLSLLLFLTMLTILSACSMNETQPMVSQHEAQLKIPEAQLNIEVASMEHRGEYVEPVEASPENTASSMTNRANEPGEQHIPVLSKADNKTDNVLKPVKPSEGIRPQYKDANISNAQRFKGVLEAHNWIRQKRGLTPLKWSAKLAEYSQQWADHLGSGSHCQIRHRSGMPPYGENLYRASALRWSDGRTEQLPITIQNVVKAWTDEERWFDYQRNRCQPGKKCGHYTQVVWKDTTEVGCAVKICADKSQTWVCSYNPPGNFQGVRPY